MTYGYPTCLDGEYFAELNFTTDAKCCRQRRWATVGYWAPFSSPYEIVASNWLGVAIGISETVTRYIPKALGVEFGQSFRRQRGWTAPSGGRATATLLGLKNLFSI
jgi:hypothetical protein